MYCAASPKGFYYIFFFLVWFWLPHYIEGSLWVAVSVFCHFLWMRIVLFIYVYFLGGFWGVGGDFKHTRPYTATTTTIQASQMLLSLSHPFWIYIYPKNKKIQEYQIHWIASKTLHLHKFVYAPATHTHTERFLKWLCSLVPKFVYHITTERLFLYIFPKYVCESKFVLKRNSLWWQWRTKRFW